MTREITFRTVRNTKRINIDTIQGVHPVTDPSSTYFGGCRIDRGLHNQNCFCLESAEDVSLAIKEARDG